MNWLTGSIREFVHRGDRLLLTFYLLASGFGTVLIYSATRYIDHPAGLRCMLIQIVGIALEVLVYIAMSLVDIELLTEESWKWFFLFEPFINSLLLAPLGIGADETGSNGWLSIPGFPVNLQSTELVKLTFVLLLAWQMNRQRERGFSRPPPVFRLAGRTLAMIELIVVASSDFGMALIYAFIFAIMVWTGGVKKRWFLLAVMVCVIGAILVWPHISDKYSVRHITVVIDYIMGNTETTSGQTQGQGFQQTRNVLVIGSGGLFGMGYLKGIQTQSLLESVLPARHIDGAFTVCGEEFGLAECIVLLLLLGAIVARCIWVARRACLPQSAFVAMGYVGMLLIQVEVNVGMCLYVFPVVGLTLPFISYGDISIVTVFAAVGIVSGIKMRPLPSWLRDRSHIRISGRELADLDSLSRISPLIWQRPRMISK